VATRSGGPRLLIYSQDGLGLGHQRRTSLLAGEFLAARDDASVLTICDSPVGRFFAAGERHDYLKLPSVRKLRPGVWAPVALGLSFAEVLALRKEVIRTTALAFEPDMLLVDHMPHGAMGELVPTLEALRSRPVRRVLGLRDILDAPDTVRHRWRLEGGFEAVERHFHDVLVYGSRDVFDVAAQYGWPAEVRSRLHYCGYVCAPPPAPSAEALRRRYLRGVPGGELIVAMAGGGADAYPLFRTLLRALPALAAQRPCVVVLVTGPFLPAADRRRLERLARGLPAYLMTTVSDSLSYLRAADLVVGMAGYNTSAEVLHLARRAVLVPRAGPSEEQQMRASRFAERGWVRWLPPQALSATSLAVAIAEALEAPTGSTGKGSEGPDLRGRQRAAMHLLAGMREDHEHLARSVEDDLVPADVGKG
jgi:predicted glycosyltransferase